MVRFLKRAIEFVGEIDIALKAESSHLRNRPRWPKFFNSF